MGSVGICYACNKGTLKQDYANTIYCPVCKSKWSNNYLR